MTNTRNLKKNSERTPKERKDLAQKAGIKSGEVRRNRKQLKEELLILLEQGETQEKISLALIEKAMTGDVRAFETIRDTIGEKPTDKQEVQIPAHNYPKVFVSLEDLSDTEKMERILKNANHTEIIYVSSEDIKEVNDMIDALIDAC